MSYPKPRCVFNALNNYILIFKYQNKFNEVRVKIYVESAESLESLALFPRSLSLPTDLHIYLSTQLHIDREQMYID